MVRALMLCTATAVPACADPAQLVGVAATRAGADWRVSVTLRHDDTGWDDYADGWRVEDAEGTVLALRELLHPHVDKQPFTRSTLTSIPADARRVFIRARTSTDGWGADRTPLGLP